MGMTREQYLKFADSYYFLKTHGLSTVKQDTQKSNAHFSAQFFKIMDEDGGGVDLNELSFPLIALGLATNTDFVKKVMKILAPQKFSSGEFDQQLTVKEFSSLFRSDQVGDKMVKRIKDELYQQKLDEERLKRIEKYRAQARSSISGSCNDQCMFYKDGQLNINL